MANRWKLPWWDHFDPTYRQKYQVFIYKTKCFCDKYETCKWGVRYAQGYKEILYTEEEIKTKCDELAKQIDQDYAGQEILLVGLLKGSVPFMAELAKHLKSDVKFDFMSVSSYSGVESKTLVVRQDIKEDIRGKNVLIVEDILDTGKTLYNVKRNVKKKDMLRVLKSWLY